MKAIAVLVAISLLQLTHSACTAPAAGSNPPNYDLSKPTVYKMPSVLEEVSGIAFNHNKADTVYAEQDEEGKLFYFHLGDTEVRHTKFSKRGDFEDVAISNGTVIMLRSDGVFFTFPLSETANKETGNVNEQDDLLPRGEYESLFADEAANLLYVLCKNCSDDKAESMASGFIFAIGKDGQLSLKNNFSLDEKAVAALGGNEKKLRLKASAIARHPLSGQWYILSSVNKLLVITDNQWKPTAVYPLSTQVFTQPEGIAFDASGSLYISNEKGNAAEGTILKFAYQKK